ncbi:hypothetical protein MLD38_031399 [Melastoma candidum]|uniref:Uncharacterized protein n=1 Tax=Melastoma candidum TaxID=119954 RepID=A0ACB9MPK7_9MYRT|nr:hypothetical protein MLD38_031399 [Melastoma candidum]
MAEAVMRASAAGSGDRYCYREKEEWSSVPWGTAVSMLALVFAVAVVVTDAGARLVVAGVEHSEVHGAYCLGIFQNGKDPTTLLRGIIVRNTLVMYDRKQSHIGFCSELGKDCIYWLPRQLRNRLLMARLQTIIHCLLQHPRIP